MNVVNPAPCITRIIGEIFDQTWDYKCGRNKSNLVVELLTIAMVIGGEGTATVAGSNCS